MSIRPIEPPGGGTGRIKPPGGEIARTGAATLDTLKETGVEITREGVRATRSAHVINLTGPPEKLEWLAAHASGIPRIGQEHPGIPGLPVLSVRAKLTPNCVEQADVTIVYGFPQGDGGFGNLPGDDELPQIEIAATSQPSTTMFFYPIDTGTEANTIREQIKLYHTFLDVDPDTGTTTPRVGLTRSAEVEFQQPTIVVRFRRRERYSPASNDNPDVTQRRKSQRFLAHVNGLEFWGELSHKWLCTRLDGVSDDGGLSYNVTYELQLSPKLEGWDTTVVYPDPDTGEPVVDPVPWSLEEPEGGIRVVRVLPVEDFEDMRLV